MTRPGNQCSYNDAVGSNIFNIFQICKIAKTVLCSIYRQTADIRFPGMVSQTAGVLDYV